MLIPKIIHQTIRDKRNLHPEIEKNIARLSALNPDWDYRLYDDRDIREFVSHAYGPGYLRSFDRIQPAYGAAKADFFRYLVIHHTGGVYLDIKSTADRPLSSVIGDTDSMILSHWTQPDGADVRRPGHWPAFGVPNEFQQWHVIARPAHPYLAEVVRRIKANIDDYDPRKFGVGTVGTLRTTGPIAYSLALDTQIDGAQHRLVDIGDLGFRYTIFEDFGDQHRTYIGSSYATAQSPVATLSPARSALYLLHRAQRKLHHIVDRVQSVTGAQAA